MMTVMNTPSRTILILGGYGTFGSLITEQLAKTDAYITIAGRNTRKGQAFAEQHQVNFLQCDVNQPQDLATAINKQWLVINASGPFQAQDYRIPRACIAAGCNYIDLGDGRDYVAGITTLHAEAVENGVFVCVGASTSPAVTAALVGALCTEVVSPKTIRIAMNAGNKNLAGISTIASILDYVGKPIQVWQQGAWKQDYGWGQPEFVAFPKPVGTRRVQLCDVPDLQLFPAYFDAATVTFKAGVELTLFNFAISILGIMRRWLTRLPLAKLAPLLVRGSQAFKFFGSYAGSCAVWLTDQDDHVHHIALVAPSNGPRIPTAPAILLTQKLLAGEVLPAGAYPCVDFFTLEDLARFLEQFGIYYVNAK